MSQLRKTYDEAYQQGLNHAIEVIKLAQKYNKSLEWAAQKIDELKGESSYDN